MEIHTTLGGLPVIIRKSDENNLEIVGADVHLQSLRCDNDHLLTVLHEIAPGTPDIHITENRMRALTNGGELFLSDAA